MSIPSLSSSSEGPDSIFHSYEKEENPYYKNLVAMLIDDEQSSSSPEPEDFVPYIEFWNKPAPKSEEKDK